MSYIDKITDFLLDEKRKLSSKATVLVFVILGVLFIDNILSFSYSYRSDKKIEQVKKLNLVINDVTSDSTTKAFALDLRTETIRRKNIIDYFLSLLSSNADIKFNNMVSAQIENISEPGPIKNNFWFYISAGGIYFLLALLIIPLMFLNDKIPSIFQRIATGISTSISFVLLGMFFIWCDSFIPLISKSTWFWNYIINLIIHSTLIILMIYLQVKKQRL